MDEFPDYLDDNTFYQLASNSEEFPRIASPKTADDELLRIQADAITNHVRIYRVMLARARRRKLDSLLVDEHKEDFDEYLSNIPEYERLICEHIPKRYILTHNYDAMCLKTDHGNVIIVFEVLRYFLYYINLGTMTFSLNVPNIVRNNAVFISIRTMMLKETLDFDLDPRGIVPPQFIMNYPTWFAGR